MNYADFIAAKRKTAPECGFEPGSVSDRLFEFQADIVRWSIRRGRSAIWADCGLGKGWMALEWSRLVCEHSGDRVLILAPLAVAQQFKQEARKLDVELTLCRTENDVRPGINVTNYERLHLFDARGFVGVVADESSILKNYAGATRNAIIDAFSETPYRLACTATPAPNDHMELANHAEFLGVMTRTEMLSMYFTHDGGDTSKWRLKGHAKKDFWKWVCAWAVSIKRPSDLGYSDEGFNLPPLRMHEHTVNATDEFARERGLLFSLGAKTLDDQRAARRSSLKKRVEKCADIVNDGSGPWIIWCDLNDESSMLTNLIDGAVEIRGSDDADTKERRIEAFTRGDVRALVTKPSIAGWGVNWQHCNRVAFVGLSHSFEQFYQAIRRTWRFGQSSPVDCHLITSDAEHAVISSLQRKQEDAESMAREMVMGMADISSREIRGTRRDEADYSPSVQMSIPCWLKEEVS